jgi:hypothetical protein
MLFCQKVKHTLQFGGIFMYSTLLRVYIAPSSGSATPTPPPQVGASSGGGGVSLLQLKALVFPTRGIVASRPAQKCRRSMKERMNSNMNVMETCVTLVYEM